MDYWRQFATTAFSASRLNSDHPIGTMNPVR